MLKILIKPFRGLRPKPEFAKEVIAPPYDVVSGLEARALANSKPHNFLHISKPEIDLPESTDVYSDIVYQTGKENFNKLLTEDILQQDLYENYYAYRLSTGNHTQTGLVAVASIAAYNQNRICKHEFTRPKKETDRVRQIDALKAQTSPVFLTFRDQAIIKQLLQQTTNSKPIYDLIQDNTRHEFWLIQDKKLTQALSTQFNALDCLYIADGHHRSAAAARIAKMYPDNLTAQYFLSVIFPASECRILDYNRIVKDLNGLSVSALLQKLNQNFMVEKSDQAVKPRQKAEYGMYLDSQWYQLQLKCPVNKTDMIQRLDVSILDKYIINPIFNIHDPRIDERIDFVGGIRGLAELEKRVQSGEMAVAFALYPTAMDELLAVADQGKVMPPKSTWFEPKLADGLVSYRIKSYS